MKTRILVVDDEPFNLEIIEEYLDGLDAEIISLEDPLLASRLIADDTAAPFDLILLDRMMPALDGLELLRQIKGEPRYATVPVVMQTAAGLPEQIREGLERGAYYYLTKPYERCTLLGIVRAALREAQFRAEARQRMALTDAALHCLRQGEFEIATLDEAMAIAPLLAQACPYPEQTLLGISELLVNAIEHGNLGIGYVEKRALKLADAWDDEIVRRLALPEHRDKRVRIHVRCRGDRTELSVSDAGQGFAWQNYLAFDPERACDPNGRGIALARTVSFETLDYQGCGNTVVAVARRHFA
jgi:CheY-like chemotaxis protein